MLTDIEYKLLVVVFGLALMLATVKTGTWFVEAYNDHQASLERQRYVKADGGPRISFSACNFGRGPSLYELVLGLQLPILLFGFFSFRMRRIEGVAFSLLAPAILLFAFATWAYTTFILWSGSEAFSYFRPSISAYFLYESTFSDWSLLFTLLALFFSLTGY